MSRWIAIRPGGIYFAHTGGIEGTRDNGANWHDASAGLWRKYTAALRVDSRRAGVLLAVGRDYDVAFDPTAPDRIAVAVGSRRGS